MSNLEDRQYNSFVKVGNLWYQRVDGNLAVKGATDFRVTPMTVDATATALPTTPFTDRVSMSIINFSDTHTLYLGKSDVTADRTASTGGWEVPAGTGLNFDFAADIAIYAIAPTGETIDIKLLEVK